MHSESFMGRQASYRYSQHLVGKPVPGSQLHLGQSSHRCAWASGNKDGLLRGWAWASIDPATDGTDPAPGNPTSFLPKKSKHLFQAERVSSLCIRPLQQFLADAEMDMHKGARQWLLKFYFYVAKSNFTGFITLKFSFEINYIYLIRKAPTW